MGMMNIFLQRYTIFMRSLPLQPLCWRGIYQTTRPTDPIKEPQRIK